MPIALALGGGAALGWAHIGFLRVLDEEGIEVGAIAGTSIGALVGLCYAAGRLDTLEEIALGFTRWRILSNIDFSLARGALLNGRHIEAMLEQYLAGVRLEDLPIPTTLVASDLALGEEARLTSGLAVPAVRASMALPGIFRPVVIDGRPMMDGCLFAVVPIGAARALAPELPLVGLDLVSAFTGSAEPPPTAQAAMRNAFLLTMVQQIRQASLLHAPDVMVAMPVRHLHPGSFDRARELIAIGREAAQEAVPAIRAAMTAQKTGSGSPLPNA